MISQKDCVFVVIDVQEKLVRAVDNAHSIFENTQKLAELANLLSVPAIVTEQYPKGLGQTIECVKKYLPVNSKFIEKTNFSALNEDEFKTQLSETNCKQVVICGIETHICVAQTTIDLLNNGFEVFVLQDVTASRNEAEHLAGLNLMRQYGAKIVTFEMLLFALLKSSKHEQFKVAQKLIL